MKTLLANHRFLLLGIGTILVGGWWHMSGMDPSAGTLGAVTHRVVYALGIFFILATRFLRSLTDNFAISGVGSMVLGILPYLAADWMLRRRRRAGAPMGSTPQHG